MTGLLYKDFLGVKGKIAGFIFGLQFVLVVLLRVIFRNSAEGDIYVLLLYSIFIMSAFCMVMFGLDTALLKMEKNTNEKRYYFSLPVSPRQYVTEKYVFFLVTLYAVLSVGMFEGMICQLFCQEVAVGINEFSVGFLIAALQSLLIPLSGGILFICSIEFAFMFAFGAKRGMQIKEGIMILLAFAFVLYMLFGDLTILDKWNFVSIILYLQEHFMVNLLVVTLPSVVGLLSYGLSYLFAVKKFEGREEWQND